jgi:hypothetical protein
MDSMSASVDENDTSHQDLSSRFLLEGYIKPAICIKRLNNSQVWVQNFKPYRRIWKLI